MEAPDKDVVLALSSYRASDCEDQSNFLPLILSAFLFVLLFVAV